MLKFDVNNPYPILDESNYTHQEAKTHAAQVDHWLGIRVQETEDQIAQDERYNPLTTHTERSFLSEYWRGLPVESLQTPYVELRNLLTQLNLTSGDSFLDLGSGYSRMAFVMDKHAPESRFIGIEYVEPRHLEALRVFGEHSISNASLVCQDLSADDFVLPQASVYFLYDFGSKPAIRKILAQIQSQARSRGVTVVGRGRSSRDLIEKENPWLSSIVQPRHFRNFSIYKTT